MTGAGRRMLAAVRRYWQAARQLATDKRVPRVVRWMLVFGAMPIPGPVDDIALVVAVLIIVIAPAMRPALADAVKTARKGA